MCTYVCTYVCLMLCFVQHFVLSIALLSVLLSSLYVTLQHTMLRLPSVSFQILSDFCNQTHLLLGFVTRSSALSLSAYSIEICVKCVLGSSLSTPESLFTAVNECGCNIPAVKLTTYNYVVKISCFFHNTNIGNIPVSY